MEILEINEDQIITDEGEINTDAFFSWAYKTNKLDWVNDESQAGEHVQTSGKLSYEEYISWSNQYLERDLKEYLSRVS